MSPRFGKGSDGSDRAGRSAEERERARLEREARRRGEPVPPLPAPTAQPEPLVEPAAPPLPPEPVAPEPEPIAFAPEPVAPEPEPEPEPDVVPARPALVWDDEDPIDIRPPAPRPTVRATPPTRPEVELGHTEDQPAVRVLGTDDDPDRPLGTKRVAASTIASAAGAEGPPRFGAPPRGKPRSRRGMRRVVPVVLILFLLALAYGYNKVMQPFHGHGGGAKVRVVVPDGSGAREIGDLLEKQGVVASGAIFSLRARLSGDRDKLRSGTYVLPKDSSYKDVLTALTAKPAPTAPTVDVAIPEGLTIKQIASLSRQANLKGSYAKATRSASARAKARALGAPKTIKVLEGYLWPATYRLREGATAARLVSDQLKTFGRETKAIDYRYAKSKQLTRYDVLIIASLVENEAQTDKDRPLIAAVIYNRLKQGMPLQIDATTRYETGNYGANARPIRQSELDANTPYNTRNRRGLPPTPISSPGLASLQAAARPAKANYLFYVVKPCGNGAHNFSSSDAKFQQDVAAYNRKRAALGGKDPSRC